MHLILILLILGISFFVGSKIFKTRQRSVLKRQPFPKAWLEYMQKNVVIYNHLPSDLQLKLQGLMQVFLKEKNFEGCGGLELTQDMKVTVAAQACLLLLKLKHNYYPKLCSILLYPSAYTSRGLEMRGGVMVEAESTRLGESWMHGTLVLAWDCVQHEAKDINDANNVILHEFAHQLDQEDGLGDGVPILESGMDYKEWQQIFSSAFGQFLEKLKHHKHDIIDPYGATNPAEFFAVVTEIFFKKPKQLKREHQKLYLELQAYYKLDPVLWF